MAQKINVWNDAEYAETHEKKWDLFKFEGLISVFSIIFFIQEFLSSYNPLESIVVFFSFFGMKSENLMKKAPTSTSREAQR